MVWVEIKPKIKFWSLIDHVTYMVLSSDESLHSPDLAVESLCFLGECVVISGAGVMLLLYWSVPLRTWQDSKQLWSPSPGTSLQSLYSDLMRAGMGWPWGCWPLRDGLTRLVSAHLNTPDIRIYWDYFCLIRSALARMIKEAEWSNQPGARDVCWSGEGGGGLDFTKNTLGTLF